MRCTVVRQRELCPDELDEHVGGIQRSRAADRLLGALGVTDLVPRERDDAPELDVFGEPLDRFFGREERLERGSFVECRSHELCALSDNAMMQDDGTLKLDADGNEIHHHTTIRALYNDTNGDGNTFNDGTGSANYFNGNAYELANGAGGERDAAGNRGVGTDTTIKWNPTRMKANGRADISLVHEAQHALHDTQGTTATGSYAGPAGHVDNGIKNYERQAVGLGRSDTPDGSTHYPGDPDGCTENTYRAERNALGDNFVNRDTYR